MNIKQNINTTLVILYKIEHVDMALTHFGVEELTKGVGYVVAPTDYEVEMELKKRGIPYQSLEEYQPQSSFKDRVRISALLMRNWHKSNELNFFKHKDIHIGEIIEYSLGEYLLLVLYYIDVFSFIFDKSLNVDTIYISEPTTNLSSTVGQLARFEILAPLEIVKLLSHNRGLNVCAIPHSANIVSKRKFNMAVRVLIRRVFIIGLKALNSVIAPFRHKNAMKIFVSDYWWHIDPFITTMSDVEITMMERGEIKNIRAYIWKYKILFNQVGDYLTSSIRKKACEKCIEFDRAWKALGDSTPFKKEFVYLGVPFWEIVKPAYDHLVTSFSRNIVESIDGAERLLKRQGIHAVILRASVSGQIHFGVLALVARKLHIPAIELQHGLEYFDSTSHTAKKAAGIVASYGPLVKKDLEQANDSTFTALNIGSPRFDQYLNKSISEKRKEALREKLRIDVSRPVVLYIAPEVVIGQTYDSYDVVRTFKNLSSLQSIEGLQIVVKIRPGPDREIFFKNVLKETLGEKCILAQYEDMQELFSISDIVISCFSTVVLESMVGQKPVILDGNNSSDLMFMESHFLPYEKDGAIIISRTEKGLNGHVKELLDPVKAEKMVEKANKFLKNNFCFDGMSAERMSDFLKKIYFKS